MGGLELNLGGLEARRGSLAPLPLGCLPGDSLPYFIRISKLPSSFSRDGGWDDGSGAAWDWPGTDRAPSAWITLQQQHHVCAAAPQGRNAKKTSDWGNPAGPIPSAVGRPKFADDCVCRGSVQLDTGAALAVPTPRPRSRRTAPHRGAGSAQPVPGGWITDRDARHRCSRAAQRHSL